MDKCTKDETGKPYGRWTVLSQTVPPEGNKGLGAWWLCECSCDKKTRKAIRGGTLRQGDSQSCGCFAQEIAKHPRKADAAFCAVFTKIKQSSLRRGLSCDLSLEDIKELVVKDCEYCGRKPLNTDARLRDKYNFVYNGLDRVNNALGYTRANVVPCCCICNTAKMKQSKKEFLDWVEAVYNRRDIWGRNE